ncbi:MAG TPA: amidohydrolase family protein [Desulfohalobiaceae bacterium]|nr:amidohydrolase family protein [Desulfohalobiaceae bacterium]
MIIDSHVHITPPEVRKDRQPFLKAEPEFSVIYQNPKARLVGAAEVIKSMDDHGIDKSFVFGFPWRKEAHYRLNNDYVLEAAKRFPERLIPFTCLEISQPGAEKEIQRSLSAGAHGLGELAFYENGLHEQARQSLIRIADICRQANCPILLHTNEPIGHSYPGKSPMTLYQIYQLLKQTPDNKWILAHLGGGLPFFGFMKKEISNVLENCWFDTAAVPFLYQPQALAAMAQALGIEKLLFGTDFPLLPPSRYYKEFAQSGLTEDQLADLYGHNAQKIFNFTDHA